MSSIARLQVILKVVERCNMACSYCYYFEGGDQSYKSRPAVISMDVVYKLAEFIKTGIRDLNLDAVVIAFHGGEPMMLKPRKFDNICAFLRHELGSATSLAFSIQTNGAHLNREWLQLFRKYDVQVGVSIDGLRQEQNRFRKFHNGRGSYDAVARNLTVLKDDQATYGQVTDVLSVLNARNDYKTVLRGLHAEFGIEHFGFLLPDCNWDDGIPEGYHAEDYGRALCDIFDAWVELGCVEVREIRDLLRRFQLAREVTDAKQTRHGGLATTFDGHNQIVVIRSDGEVQVDDTYIPASAWRNKLPRVYLGEMSLGEYLGQPVFEDIQAFYDATPDACQSCVWRNICNGGDLENRYSRDAGFNNPSVYCSGLKMLYKKVALFLRRNGYPKEVLRDRLLPERGGVARFAK